MSLSADNLALIEGSVPATYQAAAKNVMGAIERYGHCTPYTRGSQSHAAQFLETLGVLTSEPSGSPASPLIYRASTKPREVVL